MVIEKLRTLQVFFMPSLEAVIPEPWPLNDRKEPVFYYDHPGGFFCRCESCHLVKDIKELRTNGTVSM